MTVTRSWLDPAGPAVIVDPYSSGAQIARKFTARGVDVVAVTSSPRPPAVYAASYRPRDFPEILVDDGDRDAVLDRLRALRPRCVVAGCESGVELAEALAPLVVPQVANVAALAPARRHKGAMADAVAAHGLAVIRQICTDDAEAVAAWIAESGLGGRDLVLKPPKSASTDGVTRVAGGRGWRAVFHALLGAENRLGVVNERVLVQELVRGIEYVVDTFSHDGRHSVADVCRYTKTDNGPHMAVYDHMDWVAPDDGCVAEVVAYARGVLDAVGMRFGAAHVEIMLTAEGPVLIEMAARAHGGGHPRFSRLATGDSQLHRMVRWFTDRTPVPAHYALHAPTTVVFHRMDASGTVRNAAALDRIDTLPSHVHSVRHIRDGDRLTMTSDLFASLDLGFAVLSHPDPAQVDHDRALVRAWEAQILAAPAPGGTLAGTGAAR